MCIRHSQIGWTLSWGFSGRTPGEVLLLVDERVLMRPEMWCYAVIAGTAAALSAVSAKLAFADISQVSFFIYILCYILCNVLMWWAHTTAMRESSSSLKGLLGNFIFHEEHSLRWWFGLSLIFCGAVVVSQCKEGSEKA
ncbi:unnamed protein product [Toxocara canis]|uniref:Transmembrane protein n=1 Tax=Toxocara canis TaxID=6265 RepID=A0A183UK17_TOXCA|nr:unnamed protein product [Toxocara canis]